MSEQEIPPRVDTFIADHIESVEQFQLLIRLVDSPGRWWDASGAARDLGFAELDARAALDHLAKHNLLDIRITGDVRYQFRPGTDELRVAALACADAFRRRPLQVLQMLKRPRPSLREFADAFRIRRDDDR